jgi:hypothetical protein
VASSGSHPCRASLFGAYSRPLGIRASGWSQRFEECILASAEAIELEEDLASVVASVGDLISVEEVEDMAGADKTLDFGPSLMTKDMIKRF